MATTLRWQDVAGQVDAPDTSSAAALISEGISGLGQSIQQILLAPETRRREALAMEAKLLGMQREMVGESANKLTSFGKEARELDNVRADEEWSGAQSLLEEAAWNAGLNGKSLDDVYKSDAFQRLSPKAQSRAKDELSDVLRNAVGVRDQRIQQELANRRAAESMAIQRAQEARSQQLHKITLEKYAREEKERKAAEAAKRYSNDPETQRTLERRELALGEAFFNAEGGEFSARGKKGGVTIGELTKGILDPDDAAEAETAFNQFNRDFKKRTGIELPPGVLKSALDSGVGINDGLPGVFNDYDPDALNRHLALKADEYLALQVQRRNLQQEIEDARAGRYFRDPSLDALLKGVTPVRQAPTPQVGKPYGPQGQKAPPWLSGYGR